MSWLTNLAHVYDVLLYEKSQGKSVENLIPLFHNTQNAQIEVIIDTEGDFVQGARIDKNDAPTLIPVTETSSKRTSGSSPHALHDTLWYVAGDLEKYLGDHPKKSKAKQEYFEAYIENLEAWCNNAPTNEKIAAVNTYLKKERLCEDLIDSGVLTVTDDALDASDKIQNQPQDKALVRFIVEDGLDEHKLWEDTETQTDYMHYAQTQRIGESEDLCYATGENKIIGRLHSKAIRFSGDGTKLISSNDSTNYTYRGRFEAPQEAMGVSYEVSDKAHFALKWLISKYAYQRDGYTLVTWKADGTPALNPLEGTEKIAQQIYQNGYQPEFDTVGRNTKQDVKKVFQGHWPDVDEERVSVMVLNAATPGRLAIHYYREFEATEYWKRLMYWHDTMQWPRRSKKANQGEIELDYQAPSILDIINVAFGTEQGAFLKTDDKLIKPTISRLLPCVLEQKKLPEDIVRAAAQRATRFESMSDSNWWKSLNVACALIKKYRNERFEEGWDLALDTMNTNRSYLYGRLLAIADAIEDQANFLKKNERASSSKRLLSTFSKRPYRTWGTLYKGVQPYLLNLKPGSQKFYLDKIAEVMAMFEPGDFEKTTALEDIFLLGYFHQQKALRPTQEMKSVEEHVDNNEEEQ